MTLDSLGIERAEINPSGLQLAGGFMNGMLNERITELKTSIQALWSRVHKDEDMDEDMGMDSDSDRNYEDDMPLTLAREDGPNVKYYTTENNPLAAGAEKEDAIGIDSFGEDDSPDPEQIATREY